MDDLPEWLQSVKGFELFTEGESDDAPAEFPSGVWAEVSGQETTQVRNRAWRSHRRGSC